MSARGKKVAKIASLPQLVYPQRSAEIPGWSVNALKRWRYEDVGTEWVELEGRVGYDVKVLLAYIEKNTRVPSLRPAHSLGRLV